MKLTKEQRENIEKITKMLMKASKTFVWIKTEQGLDYWRDVYNNLLGILRTKTCPHCGEELEDE